jgi:sigma-B regulation protein RsbU (phosphoserine phosphatase)
VDQGSHTIVAKHTTVTDAAALREDLRSYLIVFEGPEPVARHIITPEHLTVGRDAARSIVILDGKVSRLHLQVALVANEVIVEDLGSSNGTFMDGHRLSGPTVLPPNHWVQLGHHLLKHERRSQREVERDDELKRDLEKARHYVESLLPAPVRTGDVRVDWFHRPSAALGGDAFSYGPLDEDHLVACLVDVSGHGVEAAMHSVSVLNVLRQRALPGVDLRDPAQVLDALNAMFLMEEHGGLFFTVWYGVYCRSRRRIRYATAGHHPGFLFAPGHPREPLRTRGPIIGAIPGQRYVAGEATVPPGSVLYLFSDGAFEVTSPEGRQLGLDDFLLLLGGPESGTSGEAEHIYKAVKGHARQGPLDDDFSVLAVSFD